MFDEKSRMQAVVRHVNSKHEEGSSLRTYIWASSGTANGVVLSYQQVYHSLQLAMLSIELDVLTQEWFHSDH